MFNILTFHGPEAMITTSLSCPGPLCPVIIFYSLHQQGLVLFSHVEARRIDCHGLRDIECLVDALPGSLDSARFRGTVHLEKGRSIENCWYIVGIGTPKGHPLSGSRNHQKSLISPDIPMAWPLILVLDHERTTLHQKMFKMAWRSNTRPATQTIPCLSMLKWKLKI